MAKNDVSLTISANAGSAISEINKVKSSVEKAAGAVSQAANPINKFGEQVKSLGRTSASVAQEFDKVTQATNSIASAANRTSAVNRKHQDTIRKLGGAYRSTRMAVQNFSFQIQDIAVQLTMGTNAALVLAQQLPQLLSGFGVYGAILGGVTAVIAGLSMAFIAARRDAESFSSSLFQLSVDAENLNRVIDKSNGLVKTFGSDVEVISNVGKRLAIMDALGELSKSLGLIEERSFWDFVNTDSPFFTALNLWANRSDEVTSTLIKKNAAVASLDRGLKSLSEKLNISGDEALDFTKQLAEVIKSPTRKGVDDLVKTLTDFQLSGKGFDGLTKVIADLKIIADALGKSPLEKTLERLKEDFEITVEQQERAAKKREADERKYNAILTKRLAYFDQQIKQQDRLAEAERNRQASLVSRTTKSLGLMETEAGILEARASLMKEGKDAAELESGAQRMLAIARFEASVAGIKDEKDRQKIIERYIAALDRRLAAEKNIADQIAATKQSEKERNNAIKERLAYFDQEIKKQDELYNKRMAMMRMPTPRPRGIGDDGIIDLTDPGGVAAGFNKQAESIKRARDPLYAYLKDMEALRKNVKEGTDTFKILEEQITKTFEDATSKIKPMQEEVKKLEEQLVDNLGSALGDVITGTKSAKDAFKAFVGEALQGIIKLIFKMEELNNKQINLGGGGGSSGGGILGSIFKFLSNSSSSGSPLSDEIAMIGDVSGQMAKGGPVMGGRTYLVGEKGPELFTAPKSGQIVPNHKLDSGSGVTVNQTFQISTGVAQTVRAEIVGMMPAIQQQTIAAVANQKSRGGSRGNRL